MPDYVLGEGERTFLRALSDMGVRFLIVGMSAALLQGARGATEDIDLWFERLDDPRIGDAARRAGGFWVSGTYGMRPPGLGGEALGDRFDVIVNMHGLGSFSQEFGNAVPVEIDGVAVLVLGLDRIIASKRAAGRPKDLAQLPVLEEALVVASDGEAPDEPSSQ